MSIFAIIEEKKFTCLVPEENLEIAVIEILLVAKG